MIVINESDLYISQFQTIFFLIAFIVSIIGFFYFFLKYYLFKTNELEKKLKKGKRVVLMDFNGNYADIGKFVKYYVKDGKPVIYTDLGKEYKEYQIWYMNVYDNKLISSTIEYPDFICFFTDFKKSENYLEDHQIYSIIHKDILVTGFTKGIRQVKREILPLLKTIDDLHDTIDDLIEDLRLAKKNQALHKYIVIREQENSLIPLFQELDKRIYSASLLISQKLKSVRLESDKIQDSEIDKIKALKETKSNKEEAKALILTESKEIPKELVSEETEAET